MTKEELKKCILIKLVKGKEEITCGFFSSFYEEGNVMQRCILDELFPEDIQFSREEVGKMCRYFNEKIICKCTCSGKRTRNEDNINTKTDVFLNKVRERYNKSTERYK